jgi:two-component system, OmpR family, KDP operon response regulator KdpE
MSLLSNKTILVVDDEPRMVRFVRMNLELEGCRVIPAANGLEALEKVREDIPDLVLLDVMMPEMDGFEALKRIRETSTVPVIMVTVKAEEDDLIKGLELGADDYVTKPFSPRELISRMKAVLRRVEMESPSTSGNMLTVDSDLSIDFQRHEVIVRGERIKLRPTEYRLLYHLVNNPGWVMTHEMLLSKVWGYEYRDDSHLLRLYITYLRKKIEPNPSEPKYILTERGVGYLFADFRGGTRDAKPPAEARPSD